MVPYSVYQSATGRKNVNVATAMLMFEIPSLDPDENKFSPAGLREIINIAHALAPHIVGLFLYYSDTASTIFTSHIRDFNVFSIPAFSVNCASGHPTHVP